jgi:hypothetical protein
MLASDHLITELSPRMIRCVILQVLLMSVFEANHAARRKGRIIIMLHTNDYLEYYGSSVLVWI